MDLQARCALGQEQLMAMEYLQAERTLAAAEAEAWESQDLDALARLYMPLQEARRQRRQRCAEGKLAIKVVERETDPAIILGDLRQGEMIVASARSIAPASGVRRLVAEHDLYVDVFLATVLKLPRRTIIGIIPFADVDAPAQHPVMLDETELPKDMRGMMDLWERLHRPFLSAAEAEIDPIRKIEGFRATIAVDYACELAHQHLADVARQLCQTRKET